MRSIEINENRRFPFMLRYGAVDKNLVRILHKKICAYDQTQDIICPIYVCTPDGSYCKVGIVISPALKKESETIHAQD